MQSLAVLACYFGKLPWYFNYFIHSCKYNPTIDFFIVTDDVSYTRHLPSNVKIIHSTLSEISLLATLKLNLSVDIKTGYKLCDFKPAYGMIFSQVLSSYDYWAYSDIDVIYGNIREFVSEDLLGIYDLINIRPDWIHGCFAVFKNSDKMNKLFEQSKDYVKVLTSEEHYCFDETNFAHVDFSNGVYFKEIKTQIESMTHVIKRMEERGEIRVFYELYMVEGIIGKLKWERGRLIYFNKYEIILYHLVHFKKNYKPENSYLKIPDRFTISPSRIYHR